jgi:hypothetical protein
MNNISKIQNQNTNNLTDNNTINNGVINNKNNNVNNNNFLKSISNSNNLGSNQNMELKKENLILGLNEEDKSIFVRSYKSPNPFDDYNFAQNSNIFNSPNPMEGIMYKLSTDNNEKMNINFDLSRNSSIDYNEIFKSGTLNDNMEEKKLPKENNIFFDDSFFSISSNDKKSEAVSEPFQKNKGNTKEFNYKDIKKE